MKKIICFFTILINFFSCNVKADIAYIDIKYILNKSEVGKYLNTHVEKKRTNYTLKFKEIENELIKKEKALLSQQNILNKNEFEKKLKTLSKEVQKYRDDKKTSIDGLNKFKVDNTKEILKVLNPIIKEFVNLNSISIVIPKKNIIVGKKNLDITNEILNLLNKSIVKLNF